MFFSRRIEIVAGALLDEVAPQIDDLVGGGRGLCAGQPLAHHQRDRILDRRIGAVGDLLVFAATMVAIVEHRGDVGGDARHAARADGLDPRLLDRIEDRARRLPFGRELAMNGIVVTGEPKGHGIGVAAQDRHILQRQPPRRLGQADLVAHEGGTIRRECHLEVGLARQRLDAAGDRALQRLGRRFLLLTWLAVRDGHGTLEPDPRTECA